RNEPFERRGRIRASERDLAHMRHVEKAGLRSGMEMLGENARRILDRHLVAGKRHHLGAELAVESVERGPLERRCRRGKGHLGTSDRAEAAASDTAPSVVDPESFTPAAGEPRPGLTPSVSDRRYRPAAAFQSALAPAVLLPESFRGGCSFGAAPCRAT